MGFRILPVNFAKSRKKRDSRCGGTLLRHWLRSPSGAVRSDGARRRHSGLFTPMSMSSQSARAQHSLYIATSLVAPTRSSVKHRYQLHHSVPGKVLPRSASVPILGELSDVHFDAIIGLFSSCFLIGSLLGSTTGKTKDGEAQVVAQQLRRPSDFDWGVGEEIGPRDYMEDTYYISKCRDHFFAAVYDGHGGSGSSQYLQSNFYKFVNTALGKNRRMMDNYFSNPEQVDLIVQGLMSNAFADADSALIDYIADLGDPECWSGSTATVCIVNSSLVICANIGDSKAVLCRGGKPIDLSVDHRPSSSSKCGRSEMKRINDAGGWISQSRVCGILAVTRAFGDYEFKGGRFELLDELKQSDDKLASSATLETPPVICEPHCCTMQRSQLDEFIILATDGLWDTMNSAQAVTFVRGMMKLNPDQTMQEVADALVERAIRCRTQDNVACVVLKLS